MASQKERTLLFVRTVRHLRPTQIVHRARLRAQLGVIRHAPFLARFLTTRRRGRVGWPADFAPLDLRRAYPSRDAELLAAGKFRLLGEERELGNPPDWQHTSQSRLWRFRLHDFEWSFVFAQHADREWSRREFRRLWDSWRTTVRFGDRDAWAPYVASLRAWALLCVFDRLIRGSPLEPAYVDELALHTGFVRAHLERDVAGNHLIKNLKALLGLGIFLNDRLLSSRALHGLVDAARSQVLRDGGHYERSPSYHCQVLGDLIDSRELARSADLVRSDELDQIISKMRLWLGAVLLPDGDVPLFNDCTLVGPDEIALLAPIQPEPSRLVVLEPSGYVVARPNERLHLVLDVGPPCPPELPAHAHADCLSFELAVDGRRLLVDTGTSTYDAGCRRQYERSTSAHNTLEVDGQDQSEVWSVFRTARRAVPKLESAEVHTEEVVVSASHTGYRRLPGRPAHRRTWQVTANRVVIFDELLGSGHHHAVARLHLAPGLDATRDGSDVQIGPLTIGSSVPLFIEREMVATGFNELWPSHVVSAELEQGLPICVTTEIRLDESEPERSRCGMVG